MKSKYIIIQIICILFISNPLAIYAQSDLYYWGYKTKYPLTADSLQAVLIPNNVNRQLNFQSLNAMVESKSMSALQNRKEVMLKVKNTSTLKNQKFNDFHLLPVFKSGDFPLIPTGEIVFQPKENVGYQQVIAFCKGNITFQNQSKYGTITVTPKNIEELLSLANQIYQSGLVEWCEPNFIVEIVKHQQIPSDQFFGQQYYLNQNNNIDINAPEAWQLSTGLNGVRVAVIDDGVEAHDDLNGRVLQGFTPLDPNGFGAPTNNLPPVNEYIVGHGQACAGIIGATHDNVGVAGISPCSEIVPVNIFNSWFLDFNFPPGQRLRWVEDAQDIADAINWAWDDGEAEVLSNSWGYRTTNPNNIPQSGQIIQAIENARTLGRGGFGSVVVFSSGNSNQQFNGVTFPANVEGVITVGAIDRNGNIHGYSSRGAEMDLVAPSGGNPGDVVTIDRMGDLGYNDGNNPNYAFEFNGTSAAAPQVSGVAALMLSVNPNLTETQVRTILQQTATDMGPNGFDNTFGFGRLNAEKAVKAALPTLTGPSLVCTTNSTFNLSNVPPGATVSWTRSSNLTLVSSNNTSATVRAANTIVGGSGWVRATINGVCGSFNVQKDMWVGRPNSPVLNDYYHALTPGQAKTISVLSSWNNQVSWSKSGSSAVFLSYNNNNAVIEGRSSGYTYFKATNSNACGFSSSTFTANVSSGGGGGGGCSGCPSDPMITVPYPNPNNGMLTLTSNMDMTAEVIITTSTNEVASRHLLKGDQHKIDVSKLQPGLYYLKIRSSSYQDVKRIIIK